MPEAPEEPEEAPGLDRHIRPYFSDPALWPVTIVLLIVFATFGATILLTALRSRNLFAVGALLALAVATAEAVRLDLRRRRLGAASGLILGLWALSALVAAVAAWFGAF